MDPTLAKDFFEGKGYIFTCPSCNQNIRLVTTIIINTLRGMFSISTDSSEEERKNLYDHYGLLTDTGEFGNPQEEWLLRQFAEKGAPEDTKTQIRRLDKILVEIFEKLVLYKTKLREKCPLNEKEKEEYIILQNRWEEEHNRENNYLYHPKTAESRLKTSALFQKLWEDLVKIKTELDELK